MALQENTTHAVQKASKESSGNANVAVTSQQKPDSRKQTHEELRKEGLTPSSGILPKLELFLDMVRHSRGLILNALTGKDGSVPCFEDDADGKIPESPDRSQPIAPPRIVLSKPAGIIEKSGIQGPAEPTKAENFYPKNGVYNPAAPPGIGDTQPGKAFDNEVDTGKGNMGLAWREVPTRKNADGTIIHDYIGSLQDTGLLPWEKDNTNFSGNEKWSKEGSLLERSVRYSSGLNIKFATNSGPQEIQDVRRIDTAYNPKSGNYDTVITTADGRKCNAETGADG